MATRRVLPSVLAEVLSASALLLSVPPDAQPVKLQARAKVQAMTAAARAAFAMGKLRDRERFIGGLLGFRLQVRNQVHASIQNRLRHSYSLAWLSWYGK